MTLPDKLDSRSINLYKYIGNKIRESRIKKNWSQETFAEKIGFQKGTITNLENGKQRIFLDQLINWSDLLNIDFKDLLRDIKQDYNDNLKSMINNDDNLTDDIKKILLYYVDKK